MLLSLGKGPRKDFACRSDEGPIQLKKPNGSKVNVLPVEKWSLEDGAAHRDLISRQQRAMNRLENNTFQGQ
jgi:hypothetical protein